MPKETLRDDLFPPLVGVAAVVADAGEVVDHGAVEVQEEEVRGDGIGEGGPVVAAILVVPVLHGVVVGIGQGDRVDALVHLDELMGVGAHGRQVVLHGQVHVRGADALAGLLREAADDHVLPLPAEAAAAAELGEFEGIYPVFE